MDLDIKTAILLLFFNFFFISQFVIKKITL